MSLRTSISSRPLIFLYDGKICHEGSGECTIRFSNEKISVDCTDITPDALCELYYRYKSWKMDELEKDKLPQ